MQSDTFKSLKMEKATTFKGNFPFNITLYRYHINSLPYSATGNSALLQ